MSVSAALRTLLWSESVCPDGSADVPADHYSAHPSLIARLESDWEEFTDRLPADFEPENQWQGMSPEPEWDAWDQLAHDWILTRNHHGAGFWDGDWIEPVASHLTNLAHKSGELSAFCATQKSTPTAEQSCSLSIAPELGS